MLRDIKIWLYDILNAITEIESFLKDTPNNFNYFENDTITKRAIERNIEIIGEAVNRILHKDDSIVLSNAKKIVQTRNKIIHEYDSVSDEIIWSIVIRHLPILKTEIEELLSK